jgi:DNA-binding response OmpR family regulator
MVGDMIGLSDHSPKFESLQSVLIVEDDAITRGTLKRLLAAAGYRAQAVSSAEEAVELLEQQDVVPVLALVDLDLPGMSGLELIRWMEKFNPSVVALLITAAGPERLDSFHRHYPARYLRKPLDFQHLLNVMDRHCVSH